MLRHLVELTPWPMREQFDDRHRGVPVKYVQDLPGGTTEAASRRRLANRIHARRDDPRAGVARLRRGGGPEAQASTAGRVRRGPERLAVHRLRDRGRRGRVGRRHRELCRRSRRRFTGVRPRIAASIRRILLPASGVASMA